MPPAAPSSSHSAAHGHQYDLGASKRRRGMIACAECRRLKLKCSKTIPCDQCRKRGAGPICPDGTLETGKGNRMIITGTAELHDRVDTLGVRIRALEEALAEVHLTSTASPHPLLAQELLSIKAPMGTSNAEDGPDGAGDISGPLTLPENAVNWDDGLPFPRQTLDTDDNTQEDLDLEDAEIATQLLSLGSSIPLNLLYDPYRGLRPELRKFLPPPQEAMALARAYFEYAAPLLNVIEEETFYRETFNRICLSQEPAPDHHLALLLLVLALGHFYTHPDPLPQANTYIWVARTALALDATFDNASATTVQAVILLCNTTPFSKRASAGSECWAWLGVAMKMATGMGLHRDPKKWNLPAEESNRRTRAFWAVYVNDVWTALAFNRPISIADIQIDCPLPYFPEEKDENGTHVNSFYYWRCEFLSKVVVPMVEQVYSVKRPLTYYKTIELDTKIREQCPVPPHLVIGGSPAQGFGCSASGLTFQRYTARLARQYLLVYLHRKWTARVGPEPNQSHNQQRQHKYPQSVQAMYQCAVEIISCTEALMNFDSQRTSFQFYYLSSVFTVCLEISRLIKAMPHWPEAARALQLLERACKLFDRASANHRARSTLPQLRKLQSDAFEVYNRFAARTPAVGPIPSQLPPVPSTSRRGSSSHTPSSRTTPSLSSSSSHPVTPLDAQLLPQVAGGSTGSSSSQGSQMLHRQPLRTSGYGMDEQTQAGPSDGRHASHAPSASYGAQHPSSDAPLVHALSGAPSSSQPYYDLTEYPQQQRQESHQQQQYSPHYAQAPAFHSPQFPRLSQTQNPSPNYGSLQFSSQQYSPSAEHQYSTASQQHFEQQYSPSNQQFSRHGFPGQVYAPQELPPQQQQQPDLHRYQAQQPQLQQPQNYSPSHPTSMFIPDQNYSTASSSSQQQLQSQQYSSFQQYPEHQYHAPQQPHNLPREARYQPQNYQQNPVDQQQQSLPPAQRTGPSTHSSDPSAQAFHSLNQPRHTVHPETSLPLFHPTHVLGAQAGQHRQRPGGHAAIDASWQTLPLELQQGFPRNTVYGDVQSYGHSGQQGYPEGHTDLAEGDRGSVEHALRTGEGGAFMQPLTDESAPEAGQPHQQQGAGQWAPGMSQGHWSLPGA